MSLAGTDVLIRSLEQGGRLTAPERDALSRLDATTASVSPRVDIARAGDRPRCVHVLLTGFACRYTILPEGRRQITLFHIPGEVLDMDSLFLPVLDYDLGTLAQSQLLAIPHADMLALFRAHPRIAHLFWRETLIYASIFREWMIGLGRRQAFGRLAHLFCELIARMEAIGLAVDHQIDLPLTQIDMGDALGLSFVHVNRTLQELRGAGLIELTRGRLRAVDWPGLCKAGDFDPSYLYQQAHRIAAVASGSAYERNWHVAAGEECAGKEAKADMRPFWMDSGFDPDRTMRSVICYAAQRPATA